MKRLYIIPMLVLCLFADPTHAQTSEQHAPDGCVGWWLVEDSEKTQKEYKGKIYEVDGLYYSLYRRNLFSSETCVLYHDGAGKIFWQVQKEYDSYFTVWVYTADGGYIRWDHALVDASFIIALNTPEGNKAFVRISIYDHVLQRSQNLYMTFPIRNFIIM